MSRRKLSRTDNKYSRGVVAVCAGSKRYPGAAQLAVAGARSGNAGYVKFLSRDSALNSMVISRFPDVVPIPGLKGERFDSFLVGPGGSKVTELPEVPAVLDSAAISMVTKEGFSKRIAATVITPHEGELRYLGSSLQEHHHSSSRSEIAELIATRFGVIVVLKGPATVVAASGKKTFVDKIGGPELATAGTGDVLAGLIASMLVSVKDGLDPFNLVCDAVSLHAKAGRDAAKRYTSVTSLEVIESLRNV